MRKYRVMAIFLFIICINLNGSEDTMILNSFNYNGSRLIKISNYTKMLVKIVDQESFYYYDDDGYLISRKVYNGRGQKKQNLLYETSITYDIQNKIIKERFDRYIAGRIIPVILEYFYDENNNLIRYKRYDGNIYNDEIEEGHDIEILYNEQGDLIYIVDNYNFAPNNIYMPGSDIASYNDESNKFKYEYLENKKIRLSYITGLDVFKKEHEFIYENDLLKELKIFHGRYDYLIRTVTFTYNGKLLSGVLFKEALSPTNDKEKIMKHEYQYDKKNRLKKRIRYFHKYKSPRSVEEYFYEEGNYRHYPYLLPPKIILYQPDKQELIIDKNVY